MIDQRFLDDLAQDLKLPEDTPPEEMQLASANTGVTTDGGAFVGYRLNMPKGLNTRENQAKQSVLIADTMAGAGKGMIQAFPGLPGDLESIGRMALNYLGYNVDENTVLPTSEEIGKRLESVLGPVVPKENTLSSLIAPSEFQAERERAAKGGEMGGELLAPGGQIKLASKVAKPILSATGEIIKAGKDLPVGMGIKAVDEIPTGAPINLTPINPATFKPQTEVRAAIDVVASDPINSIYLSQAERSPSLALRIAKPTIIGTGQKNQITVEDVGTVLQKAQLSLYKNKPLDPTNKKDLTKMIDSASAEAEFQLAQPISGANWYDDDVTNAFKMSAKIVPELATDEPLRVLTTAFAASTSYNKRAGENWGVATRIAEHLLKTGKVANRNPDNGKLWGGTTGPIMEQQLKLHEFMMNKMGIDGYAEWLLTPHTVKEIKDMKAASGLYKTIDIPGKATDLKMGSFIIGEKGGAFFLNLNGIKETTADKWFTRTYNRHAGSLTSGNVSEQGLIDAPRNEAERFIMKEWNRGVASNSKLDEQANQAVLWFYEQNLYYNLGVKSAKSESFSDGAKNLLNARGLSFDESELIKSRGSSNAPKVTAEPQSPTGTGSAIGGGEVATTGTESTTVKRAKKAPTKGVQ